MERPDHCTRLRRAITALFLETSGPLLESTAWRRPERQHLRTQAPPPDSTAKGTMARCCNAARWTAARAYTRRMSEILRASWLGALFAMAVLDADGAEAERAQYVDLTAHFSRFVDETAGMEGTARIALFHKQMDTLLPGFYAPRFGLTPAQYDANIARALGESKARRREHERVQREFPAAFYAGLQHFRRAFAGFTLDVPVYLVHSVGEMDGGTRELGGKTHLIFGADVIAQLHEPGDLTAFLDHELFHVENGKHFPDCEQVWCPLWAEGLATYAAKVMNPGASDRELLLTVPKPIRPAVEANWPGALCFVRSKLFSADPADVGALFVGGADENEFPERFGYFVGMRVIEELGGEYELPELARMSPDRAKSVLMVSLDRMIHKVGGCDSAN
jgi:hypothetical protein